MKAWIFQEARQKAKLGEKKCPWYVGWYDARGKKRQKRVGPKSTAREYARKLEGESAAGLLQSHQRIKWVVFVEQFDRDHLATLEPTSRFQYKLSLDQFQEIVAPLYLDQVTAAAVDEFRAKRLKNGREPATVNKDLRHVRCALNKAKKWGLIPQKVEVELLREPERDPEFVSDGDFALLYGACNTMKQPHDRHYTAEQWWQALLVFAYMTGWRIRQILALEKANVDLEAGVAFVEAARTKGKRDARVELHPVVVQHLRPLMGFDAAVFRWPLAERGLWTHFASLKQEAGVEIPGAFHRLRFGFANANVDSLPEDVLQHLMLHKDRQTTRRYINLAKRMQRQGTAEKLHVPAVLAAQA
ncbi:site-specific tyrosine recombinase XerD [Posidoniimonas corsicana]|uniref:Site-specific tyrosine recombinase XerD n=1 Tax=Posidoniimonas corsicana TaxID=1938618 RepID=A0A5C5VDT3_9BACT|nr:tyrosine-type recombinase/integrase [Posidoniimonas corsicana]TWT35882.1 site-specific tyrosine recombinase XerD [Posidoniimonas corsicana]